MNEEFIANVEMVIYKMIEEGKLKLQKTINDKGDLRISINCYLKDEEPNEYGQYPTYVANIEGRNGVKIGNVGDME